VSFVASCEIRFAGSVFEIENRVVNGKHLSLSNVGIQTVDDRENTFSLMDAIDSGL
jgi:uncharacterized protein YjfI (DUF2170 family)